MFSYFVHDGANISDNISPKNSNIVFVDFFFTFIYFDLRCKYTNYFLLLQTYHGKFLIIMKRAAGHTTIMNILVKVSYSIFSSNSISILFL